MAKKDNEENGLVSQEVPEEYNEGGYEEGAPAPGGFKFDTDFNIEDEYKIPPIIPPAKYEAYVTEVVPDADKMSLNWTVCLKADPDILMTDNETPVNGNTMVFKNWFPKAGDELERTKTGRMTKRQAKMNMLHDFQTYMKINIGTPAAIQAGLESGEWIGLEVIVDVVARTYEGRISNQINKMVAA